MLVPQQVWCEETIQRDGATQDPTAWRADSCPHGPGFGRPSGLVHETARVPRSDDGVLTLFLNTVPYSVHRRSSYIQSPHGVSLIDAPPSPCYITIAPRTVVTMDEQVPELIT